MVHLHREQLTQYYHIEFVEDPNENPLYYATELCVEELEKCVDKVTNSNELPKLLVASKYPFVKLTRRGDTFVLTTPSDAKCDRGALFDLTEKHSKSSRYTTPSRNGGNRGQQSKKRDRNSNDYNNTKRRRASPDSVIDSSYIQTNT